MDYDKLKSRMNSKGFETGFITSDRTGYAFGIGYYTALLHQIFIDTEKKTVTYEISAVFSDDYKSTYPYETLDDIIIPENLDEFSKLVKDKKAN